MSAAGTACKAIFWPILEFIDSPGLPPGGRGLNFCVRGTHTADEKFGKKKKKKSRMNP